MIFSEPSSSTTFLFIYFPTTHFLSPSSARLVPLLSPGPSSCRQRYLRYCLEHHPTDSTPSMLGNPPPPPPVLRAGNLPTPPPKCCKSLSPTPHLQSPIVPYHSPPSMVCWKASPGGKEPSHDRKM